MPRSARHPIAIGIQHILTRGINRRQVFQCEADFQSYLRIVQLYKSRYPLKLYHYVLMPNHVHMILETYDAHSLSDFMHKVNLTYALYFQRQYSYVGHLWQNRFKNLLIERGSYLLTCARYIELNPVKAGLVTRPEEYRWSSYRVYASGEQQPMVDLNPTYLELGKTLDTRIAAYLTFFPSSPLEPYLLHGRFFGSQEYMDTMARQRGLPALPQPGRPPKIKKSLPAISAQRGRGNG